LLVLYNVNHFLIDRDARNGLLLGLQLGLERVIEALVIVGLLDVVPHSLLDVAQVLLRCGTGPIGEGYLTVLKVPYRLCAGAQLGPSRSAQEASGRRDGGGVGTAENGQRRIEISPLRFLRNVVDLQHERGSEVV